MYELGKLSFASYGDELLHLRIPTNTLFLLNDNIYFYNVFHDDQIVDFYKYCPDTNGVIQDIKYSGHSFLLNTVNLLKKAILLDKRIYYTIEHKKHLIILKPLVLDRTYRWSIAPDDFTISVWKYKTKASPPKHNVTKPLLAKALYEYYVSPKTGNIPQDNNYYADGKYFIFKSKIFYNDVVIGELINNSVHLSKEYSKLFKEDFIT